MKNERTSQDVSALASAVMRGGYKIWTLDQIVAAMQTLAASCLTQAPDKTGKTMKKKQTKKKAPVKGGKKGCK